MICQLIFNFLIANVVSSEYQVFLVIKQVVYLHGKKYNSKLIKRWQSLLIQINREAEHEKEQHKENLFNMGSENCPFG